jgi:hypothetical protein
MSEEFAIEKGVPAPPPNTRSTWHPFGQLEAGDSVFIPVKPGRSVPKIRSTAATFGRKRGWKMVSREQSGGVRVWRLE